MLGEGCVCWVRGGVCWGEVCVCWGEVRCVCAG